MTTAAFNLTADSSSDANFRTWVSALDTQILAMGWVHSTDTGQANLATMTRSITVGANYIIYKTNDGVSPALYLRMEFYGLSSTSTIGFGVQAGFATDGAGNLTGTAVTGRWTTPQGVADTVRPCIISGSTSRLTFALNLTSASLQNSVFLSIERNKTSAAADTNTGMIFTMGAGSNINANGTAKFACALYLPTTGGVPGIEGGLPCVLTNNGAGTNTFGATSGAAVPIPLAGAAQNPGLNMLVCLTAEQPTRDTTITVTMYDGSSHTYYAIGPNFTSIAACGGTVVAGTRALLRYE